MRKIVFLLSLVIVASLCAGTVIAQQYVTKPPPPPHVNKYKKKDTVKPGPYRADTLLQPIPIGRAGWHDKIDNEQTRADKADGKEDKRIKWGRDSVLTTLMTRTLIRKIDSLQLMIENMPSMGRDNVMDNQHRIRSLRAVWELMRQYNTDGKPRVPYYDSLVANMRGMLIAANENKLMDYTMANPNIYSLNNGLVLMDNQPEARAYIYTKIGTAYPLYI